MKYRMAQNTEIQRMSGSSSWVISRDVREGDSRRTGKMHGSPWEYMISRVVNPARPPASDGWVNWRQINSVG